MGTTFIELAERADREKPSPKEKKERGRKSKKDVDEEALIVSAEEGEPTELLDEAEMWRELEATEKFLARWKEKSPAANDPVGFYFSQAAKYPTPEFAEEQQQAKAMEAAWNRLYDEVARHPVTRDLLMRELRRTQDGGEKKRVVCEHVVGIVCREEGESGDRTLLSGKVDPNKVHFQAWIRSTLRTLDGMRERLRTEGDPDRRGQIEDHMVVLLAETPIKTSFLLEACEMSNGKVGVFDRYPEAAGLSSEEHQRRVQRINALFEEWTAKRNELIQGHLRGVVSVALKYWNRKNSADLLDLIQCGNLALMRAAGKFEWRRGWKFLTYAYWWVEQFVSRHAVENRSGAVHIPGYLVTDGLQKKIRQTRKAFWYEHQRYPNRDELEELLLEIDPDFPVELLGKATASCSSLDRPPKDYAGDDDKLALARCAPDRGARVPNACMTLEVGQAIQETMATLHGRELEIVRWRTGLHDGQMLSAAEIDSVLSANRDGTDETEVGLLLSRLAEHSSVPQGERDIADPEFLQELAADVRNGERDLFRGFLHREQFILRLRLGITYGLRLTLAQVGELCSVSRERIRQVQGAADRLVKARIRDGQSPLARMYAEKMHSGDSATPPPFLPPPRRTFGDPRLNEPVGVLDVGTRIRNFLEKEGIVWVGDLIGLDDEALLGIVGLDQYGVSCIREARDAYLQRSALPPPRPKVTAEVAFQNGSIFIQCGCGLPLGQSESEEFKLAIEELLRCHGGDFFVTRQGSEGSFFYDLRLPAGLPIGTLKGVITRLAQEDIAVPLLETTQQQGTFFTLPLPPSSALPDKTLAAMNHSVRACIAETPWQNHILPLIPAGNPALRFDACVPYDVARQVVGCVRRMLQGLSQSNGSTGGTSVG